jgi:hypothetical protein
MPAIRWQWRSTNFRKGAKDRGQYRQAAGAIEKALIWGSSVIVITERTGRLVQHNFVEYRGVRFAIPFWNRATTMARGHLSCAQSVAGREDSFRNAPRGSHNSSLNDRRSAEKAVFG